MANNNSHSNVPHPTVADIHLLLFADPFSESRPLLVPPVRQTLNVGNADQGGSNEPTVSTSVAESAPVVGDRMAIRTPPEITRMRVVNTTPFQHTHYHTPSLPPTMTPGQVQLPQIFRRRYHMYGRDITRRAKSSRIEGPSTSRFSDELPSPSRRRRSGRAISQNFAGCFTVIPNEETRSNADEDYRPAVCEHIGNRARSCPQCRLMLDRLEHRANNSWYARRSTIDNLAFSRPLLDQITLNYSVNLNVLTFFGRDDEAGATTGEIDFYTTEYKYVKKIDAEGDERCTICLSDFIPGETVRCLRCAHIFHSGCIDRWLCEKNRCPICRLSIKDDSDSFDSYDSYDPNDS